MRILYLLTLLAMFSKLNGGAAYAQIHSRETQRPKLITGSLLIAEYIGESLDLKLNFDISPNNDFLICKVKGVYFLSASIQAAALKEKINGHMSAWFEHNGKAISASSSRLYVTKESPIVLITIPFILTLEVGDTIGTRIASSDKDIGVTYIDAPSNVEPSIPSYTLSIYKIDKYPTQN